MDESYLFSSAAFAGTSPVHENFDETYNIVFLMIITINHVLASTSQIFRSFFIPFFSPMWTYKIDVLSFLLSYCKA